MSRIRLNVGLGVSILSRGTTTFEFIVILEIQLHEKNKILKNSKEKCKNCRGRVTFRWLHTVKNSSHTLEAWARYQGNIFYICLFEPISLKSEKSRLNLGYFLWKLVFGGLGISVKVGCLVSGTAEWGQLWHQPHHPSSPCACTVWQNKTDWIQAFPVPSWLCLASATLSGTLATNPSRALDRQTWQPRRDLEKTKTGTGQRSTLMKKQKMLLLSKFLKKDIHFEVLLKFLGCVLQRII